MRRKDKEITDRAAIDGIIGKALVCRLAMCDGGVPYIVPLCFGYDGASLYFHCAKEGRKLEILRRNDVVCFEFDTDTVPVRGKGPCSSTMKYLSVVGQGRAVFMEGEEARMQGLRLVMAQYGDDRHMPDGMSLENIAVIRVDISGISGKKSGW
ncbi:pyridoxamine 5'-phosphate oxidase family protein [bacterium]|nr:pyridoxamine 5'-phosphate oxidase family protein [bacterium]